MNGRHKEQGVQTTLLGDKLPPDWNFAKADTSYLVHGLHDYPARMIPQIAERLIDLYTEEGDIILDPFCGCGTTLVEAALARRHCAGGDINPFAVLLTRVKSTPLDFESAGFNHIKFLKELETGHIKAKKNNELPEPPVHVVSNLLHWFKEPVSRDLEFLYQKINGVTDIGVRDFLRVVFSHTVFKTSNIDHRSSRFIRTLPKDKLAKFSPNVLVEFKSKLLDSIERMLRYRRRIEELYGDEKTSITVKVEDARKLSCFDGIYDAVITSPPYGEEKNTIGYARWSKLSLMWLRLNEEKIKESEKKALGAYPSKNVYEQLEMLPSKTAASLLKEIVVGDERRVKDAITFFFDYLQTLKEMYRVLKHGSPCCIVIGDRSIRRRPLDMKKVTIELGRNAGLAHEKSFFREIPMKMIPWKTPTGKTISRESIIILKKL